MNSRQLPGSDIVQIGLDDIRRGTISEESLLVAIASPRLRSLGIHVGEHPSVDVPYEHALYSALEARLGNGAHAAYNALIQRVVSFANAYRKGDTIATNSVEL